MTPAPTAAPITGAVEKCETEFRFENKVTRIHEDPRVTKPYTDEQWSAVMALGEAVDQELRDNDVRLTMGGEPTFVSIDDMDGAEWNTAALGDHKRERAEVLGPEPRAQEQAGSLSGGTDDGGRRVRRVRSHGLRGRRQSRVLPH